MDENRMTCPTDEALARFFGRTADRDEVEACADHIRACPRCRLRLEALQAVESELAARLGEFVPLARRSLNAQRATAGVPPAARRRWAPAAAAALLLVTAAAGVLLVLRPAGRTPEILRSGRLSPLSLIEPKGTLAQAPTAFRWSAVRGADGYFFELFDEALETVIPKFKVTDLGITLTPDQRAGLRPGRTYIWSVEAYGDDGITIEIARQSFVISSR